MDNQEIRTYDEILDVTAQILSNIMVPVGLTEQVAKPISYAIENLRQVSQAMKDDRQKEQPKAEPEAEPVPVEGGAK